MYPRNKDIIYEFWISTKSGKELSGNKSQTFHKCNFCPKVYYGEKPSRLWVHTLFDCNDCPTKIRSMLQNTDKGRDLVQEKEDNTFKKARTRYEQKTRKLGIGSSSTNVMNIKHLNNDRLGESEKVGPPPIQNQISLPPNHFISLENGENDFKSYAADWIYSSNFPFKFVEHFAAVQLFDIFAPRYKLPSRKELSSNLLESKFDTITKDVQERILSRDDLTLVVDGWIDTNKIFTYAYLFIDPLGQLCFSKSARTPLSQIDSDILSSEMIELVEKVGIERVKSICTENTKVLNEAVKKVQGTYPKLHNVACGSLQQILLLRDLVQLPIFSSLIDEIVMINNWFIRFDVPRKALENIQKDQNGEMVELTLLIKERWQLFYRSIKGLLDSKSALQSSILSDEMKEMKEDKHFNAIKNCIEKELWWKKLSILFEVIKPILRTLVSLEIGQSKLSYIYQNFRSLQKTIKSNFGGKDLKKIEKILKNRWSKIISVPIILAYILDVKSIEEKPMNDTRINYTILTWLVSRFIEDESKATKVYKQFLNYLESREEYSNQNVWRIRKILNDSDIWWSAHFTNDLAKLAKEILSINPTSNAIERCWGTFDQERVAKQNDLNDEKVVKFQYIYMNLNFSFLKIDSKGKQPQYQSARSKNNKCTALQDEILENIQEFESIEETAENIQKEIKFVDDIDQPESEKVPYLDIESE